MGYVVQRTRSALGWRWIAAIAAIVLISPVIGACSSAGGTSPESGASASAASGTAARTDSFAMASPPPVEIQSVELREGAPGVELEVRASGAMVWTSYRNADGNLVVELPNSSPNSALTSLTASEGLVARVLVESDSSGARPVTRLTITTRDEAEHALAADGNVLRLSLLPTAKTAAVMAAEQTAADESQDTLSEESSAADERFVYEPLGDDPKRAEAAVGSIGDDSTSPVDLANLGTAESPRHGPAPSGPLASTLRDIEVFGGDTILVAGDGEFTYTTFRLENPERFVVDLIGVVNTAEVASLPVDSDRVRRVRVGQFKSVPQPVTRVVIDLARPLRPIIERTINGLQIKLGDAASIEVATVPATVPAAQTQVAEAAAAEPAPRLNSEPVAVMADAAPIDEPAYEEVSPEVKFEMAETPVVAEPAYEEPVVEQPMVEEPVVIAEQIPIASQDEPAMTEPAPIALEPVPVAVAVPAPRTAPVLEEPIPVPIEATGYRVEAARGAPQIPASNDSELFSSIPLEAEDGGDFSARVFAARPILGEERVYTGDLISMTLREADVVETLRSFATISDLSIVVQPEVEGSVTVELENVPWDQALEQILKINGLGYEIEGTIMRIAPLNILRAEAEQNAALAQAKADQVPLQTIVKRLSYSSAAEMANLLSQGGSLLSRRGSVIVDQRTNTLILKELPEYMDTVIAVIEEIDTPEPQVMIEARIIETTKRFTRSLGVRWSFNGEASARFGNTTGLQFPNNVTGDGGVNLLTGAANGFLNLSLGNVLNSFDLDVALQAAENEGLIKILSAPKIATLNNEQASIQSGLQIPVQTISNNTVTVQFINATLSLEVTPQVTAEGTVLMDIEIRKREPQLAFAVQGAANAPIATKEARTRVIVRDGGTTVIGGIYEVSSDQGEDRVPGLSNIPLLGHLFKNKRRSDQNEELLIFITPRVINL